MSDSVQRKIEKVEVIEAGTWKVTLVCGHSMTVFETEEPTFWMMGCKECQN